MGILIGLAVKINLKIGDRNFSITGIIPIGPGNVRITGIIMIGLGNFSVTGKITAQSASPA